MTRMIDDEVLRRQAYLDDELSVDEVIAYEASLSRPQRTEIDTERRFEQALGEQLAQGATCPDRLWQRLQAELAAARAGQPAAVAPPPAAPVAPVPAPGVASRPATRGWQLLSTRALPWWLAAAAMLVATLVVLALRPPAGPEIAFTDNLQAFAKDARYAGDYEKVGRELATMGINVNFHPPTTPPARGHELRLLGMNTVQKGADCCAVVYFECCGKPVAVVVCTKSCPMVDHVTCKNLDGHCYKVQNAIENVRLMAVGPHDPVEVLGLFT